MKTRLATVAVILGIVLSSRPAAADVIITPFVGANFGGDIRWFRVLANDDELFSGSVDYYRASAGLAIRF